MKISVNIIITVFFCINFNISAATYSGGMGTEASPYEISNKADLLTLRATSGDFYKYFNLTADIDLAGESFTNAVIAGSNTPFEGVFNGNGHTIYNLHINALRNENDNLGLFGIVRTGSPFYKGQIINLNLVNPEVNAGERAAHIGALCGYLRDNAFISNCVVTAAAVYSGSYNNDVGGILGRSYRGLIIDSRFTGDVMAKDNCENVGGICGCNWSYGKIERCSARSAIECYFNSHSIGGVCGLNTGSAEISDCFAIGYIYSFEFAFALGSFCGYNSGMISNCGVQGGVMAGNNSHYYGGFVGNCTSESVINSYCVSRITKNGASSNGGAFGGRSPCALSTCFYDQQEDNLSVSNGVAYSMSTAEMKQETTFSSAGWDFSSPDAKWAMSSAAGEYKGYPIPAWMNNSITSLTISGPVSVTENSTAKYTCMATFFDGSTRDISGEVNWSENKSYTKISDTGVLTVSPVTTSLSATITAEYSYNGSSTSSTKSVSVNNTPYSGGAGTFENPYIILTENDLLNLGSTVSDYDCHFRLDSDITLKASFTQAIIAPDTSTTAGFQGTVFSGVFDGNRHTIKGLSISTSTGDYTGMFGVISGDEACIKQLYLEDASIDGDKYAAPLCAYNDNGTIEECSVTGSVSGNSYVAGFCARNGNKAEITDCFTHAALSSAGSSASYIAGFCAWNDGDIDNCYVAGTYSQAFGTTNKGGFCADNTVSGSITDSFWDTTISGLSTSDGGTGKTSGTMKFITTFTTAGWNTPFPWVKSESSEDFIGYMRFYWQTEHGVEGAYDSWLSDHFSTGYPGDAIDSDLDGVSNGDEYIANTNPMDINDYLQVTVITNIASGIQIKWSSRENRKYIVEKANSLSSGFLDVATDLTFPRYSYTDTNTTSSVSGFYRLKVELQD